MARSTVVYNTLMCKLREDSGCPWRIVQQVPPHPLAKPAEAGANSRLKARPNEDQTKPLENSSAKLPPHPLAKPAEQAQTAD
jgi:hypothetical protein